MSLRIYNTLTRKKDELQPVRPGKVGMYVCGVTVYDMCHIGHARSMVFFDVVYRYLQSKGLDVTYVRNFTDVDDKIINRANEVGEDWKDLAERFIKEFYVDMDMLGLRRPTVEFYGGAVRKLLEWSPGEPMALTLGHVILGRTGAALDVARDHELVHVRQYERWGPLFVPLYLWFSLRLWLAGKDAYRDNPFEREAYGSDA